MLKNQQSRLFARRGNSLLSKKKTSHKLSLEKLEERQLLAVRVWDGGGANALWSTPENWVGDLAPQGDDNLVFADLGPTSTPWNSVNDYDPNTRFRSITISGGAYNITGNSVTLLEGVIANNPYTGTALRDTNAVGLDINLGASQTIVTATEGTKLVLTGTIHTGSTAGANLMVSFAGHGVTQVDGQITGLGSVLKTADGQLILSGDNSYAGFTTIYGGVLTVRSDHALGTSAGLGDFTRVVSGGQLQVEGDGLNIAETLWLQGFGNTGGVGGSATPYDVGGGALRGSGLSNEWSGQIVLNQAAYNANSNQLIGVDAGSTLKLTGRIAGQTQVYGGGFYKVGSGVLELGGSQAGEMVGDVFVIAGTLRLNKTADVPAFMGNVFVGALGYAADDSAVLQVASNRQQIPQANYAGYTLNRVAIYHSGKLVLDPGVTQTIGYLDMYYGEKVNTITGIGGSADVYLDTGSMLVLGGNVTATSIQQQSSSDASPSATISGPGSLNLGRLFSGAATGQNVGQRLFTVNRTYLPSAAADLEISSRITSSGPLGDAGLGLLKAGDGVLRLSGDNDYQGGTMLTAGMVEVGSDTAFGTGPIDIRLGYVRSDHDARVIPNDVYLCDSSYFVGNKDLTITGSVTLAGSASSVSRNLFVLDQAMTLTVAGRFSDDYQPMSSLRSDQWYSTQLIKQGRGELTFTNEVSINNDITIAADGGTVRLRDDGRLPHSRYVYINQGGNFILDNTGTPSLYELDRLNDLVEVSGRGGNFRFLGRAGTANTETIGSFEAYTNFNSWIESETNTGGSNKLIIGNLRRGAGASVRFIGSGTELSGSGDNQILVQNPPAMLAGYLLLNGILPYSRVEGPTSFDVATVVSAPEGFAIVPYDSYVEFNTPGVIDKSRYDSTSDIAITAPGDYYIDTALVNSLSLADGVVLHGTSDSTTLTIGGGNLRLGNGAELAVPFVYLGNPFPPSNMPANLDTIIAVRGGRTATISSGILGSGILMKTGLGRLILSGSNEFSGAFMVQEGTVTARNSSAFGAPSGGVTVTIGSCLELDGTLGNVAIGPEALALQGHGFNNFNGVVDADEDRGAIRNVAGQNSWAGNVAMTGSYYDGFAYFPSNASITALATVMGADDGSTLTLNGAISGDVELIKVGAGTLELGGTQQHISNAATRVKEGTLLLNRIAGLSNFRGSPLFVGDDDPGTPAATIRLGADEQIFDGATVRVMGDGTLDLAGYRESITALEMVISNAGGARVNIGETGNLIFQVGSNNAVIVYTLDPEATTGAVIDGGTLSLNYPIATAVTRTLIVSDSAAAEDLTITSSIRDNSGIGVASINKYGFGTLEFGGNVANTYSGTTRVYEGTLVLNKDAGKDALGGPLLIGDDSYQTSILEGGKGSDAVVWKNSEQLPDLYAAVTVYSTGVMNLAGRVESLGMAPFQTGLTVYGGSLVDVTGGRLILNGDLLTAYTYQEKARIVGGELQLGDATRGTNVAHTFNVANSTGVPFDLEISSNIVGDATAHLFKTGAGGLLLSGNNTYLGDTILFNDPSTVGIGSASPFGSGYVSLGPNTNLATEGGARTITNRISIDSTVHFGVGVSAARAGYDDYNFGGGWWDLNLAGPVTLTGSRTVNVGLPVFVTITGDIGEMYGQQNLYKGGPGFLVIEGTDWRTGLLRIASAGGSVILKDHGQLANLSGIEIYDGGSLIVDDTGLASSDRIDDTTPITIFGGTLMFGASREAGSHTRETLGIVTIGGGISPATIRAAAGPDSDSLVTIEKINPQFSYSYMEFAGGGQPLGSAQNQIRVLANSKPTMSGRPAGTLGAGDPGTEILPWAFITAPDGSTDLVTYDPAVGFKRQANYVTSMAAAGPDDNVVISGSADAITANKTINALVFKPAGAGNFGTTLTGNYTLAVTSGAVFGGTGDKQNATHNIDVAALSLGQEGNILTRSGATANYNTTIRTHNLSIAGKGETVLAGANAQTGFTFITEGVTTAKNNAAFGSIYGATYVNMGAVLQLHNVQVGNEPLRVQSPGFGSGAFDNRGGLLAVGGGVSSWGTGTTPILFQTAGASGVTLIGYFGATAGSTLDLNGTITSTSVQLHKIGEGTATLSGTQNNVGDQATYIDAGTLQLNKTPGFNAIPNTLFVGDELGGDNADRLVYLQSNQLPKIVVIIYQSGLVDLNGQNADFTPTTAGGETLLRLYVGPTSAGDIDLNGGTLTYTSANNIGADIGVYVSRNGGGPVGARIYDSAPDRGATPGALELVTSGTLTTVLGTRFYVENTPALDDFVISARIVDSTGTRLTKDQGTNTTHIHSRMVLSGDNTFTGAVTVNAGELAIASPNALGASSTGTVVNSGHALLLYGGASGLTVADEPLTLNGTGLVSNESGALRNVSGNNAWNGNITSLATARIGVERAADTLSLAGVLGGTQGFTKTLPGTLELTGPSSNTVTGTIAVAGGVLLLNMTGSAKALGGTANNTITVGNQYGPATDTVLRWGASAGDQLPDATRLDVQAGGLVDLNGRTETLVRNDTNAVQVYYSYSTSAQVVGGTINTGGTASQIFRAANTGNLSPWTSPALISANINMGSTGITFDTVDTQPRNELLVTGQITGSAPVLKTESGSLLLANTANSFTGAITINSGTLAIPDPAVLGNSSNTITFNNSNNDRAVASIRAEGAPLTLANTIVLQGAGLYAGIVGREAVTLTGPMTVNAAANSAYQLRISNYGLTTLQGDITFANNNSILQVNNMFSSPVLISGVISDAGADGLGGNYNHLQKQGFGTVTLEGANTYEGTTTVDAGILRVSNASALGQSSGPLTYTNIGAGGTVEIYGDGLTIDENFRVNGPGFGNVIQRGALRMADYRAGTNDVNTITGNVNFAANSYVGVEGTEDYLRMGGDGVISSSEIQLISITATSGTFTLAFSTTFGGVSTTAALAYNATAAQVRDALNALPSVANHGGRVDVVKDSTRNLYTVYFRDNLDNYDTATLTVPAAAGTLTTLNTGGVFGLYKVGQGMLRLTGNGSNTYGGGTFINEGTLRLNMTEGPASVFATGKGNITIGDGGGGDNADRLLIGTGSNHDQIPDYAAVIVFSSGLWDMALDADNTHGATIGSLILTRGPQIAGDVNTGSEVLGLAGGSAYASLGIYPTFPTLGVVNFGLTKGTSPAPTLGGQVHFVTEAPVVTILDSLVPDPADDLIVTATLSSDVPLWDAAGYYIPGLREGRLPSTWDEVNLNFGSYVAASPRMAETLSTGALPAMREDVPPTWGNETYVYSGRFYDEDGKFTFAENFDDYAEIILDGQRILRNTNATQITTSGTTWGRVGTRFADGSNLYGTRTNFGMGPAGDGWHDIEIRLYATGQSGITVDATHHWNYLAGEFYGYGLRYNPNEVQTIQFAGTTAGTFTLNYNGQTTGTIAWSTSIATLASNVQTALANIGIATTVKPGSTLVPTVVVEFTGAEKNTDVLLSGVHSTGTNPMTVWQTTWDGDSLYQILDPGDGSLLRTPAEITFNGKGTLNLSGVNTMMLPATVTDGRVKISGGSSLYVPNWTVKTGATLEVGAGATPLSEVQGLRFSATPTADTWTLSFDDGLGVETTAPLQWNDTAATIQDALEALPNIGEGQILVEGSHTTGFRFTFTGTLAGLPQNELTADTSLLNGGAGVTATIAELTTSLNLAGGRVTVAGSEGGDVSHYVNDLTLKGSTASALELATDGLNATGLVANRLVREPGATVSFEATNATLGDGVADLRFLSLDASAAEKGGILPYATLRGTLGVDLATDGDTFSTDYQVAAYPIVFGSYDSDINTPHGNIKLDGTEDLSALTLAGDNDINALLIGGAGYGVTIDLGGHVLGVESGLIVGLGDANVISGAAGSRLDFNPAAGDSEPLLFVDDGSLEVAAPISANLNMRKEGVGRLILSGDNSALNGTITVNQGVLTAAHNNALGSVAAGTSVSSGAALEYDASAGDIQGTTVGEVQTIVYKTNEVQKIRFIPSTGTMPTGGTFKISIDPDGAGPLPTQTTGAMNWNATAVQVRDELQALAGIGPGNVAVTMFTGAYTAGYQIAFTGALAGQDMSEMSIDTSSLLPSTSVDSDIELLKGGPGAAPANEVQILSLGPGQPTGGNFTLTFDGETTAAITWNANTTALTTAVRTALEGLKTIGTGNVVVSLPATAGSFVVTFQGMKGYTNVPQMTGDPGGLTGGPGSFSFDGSTATQGESTAFNETQAFWWSTAPASGSYTVSYNGQQTAALNWDDSASTVQTELESLYGAGNVVVAGNSVTGFFVTFTGALAGTNVANAGIVPGLVVSGPSGRTPVYATYRDGGQNMAGTWAPVFRGTAGAAVSANATASQVSAALDNIAQMGALVNEVQLLQYNSNLPTDGNYTITFRSFTTSALNYDATPAEIQAALEALPSIGAGNVTVAGTWNQGGFVVTFRGGLGGQNVEALVVDVRSLLPSVTPMTVTDNATAGGWGATNEVQAISFPDLPTAGTWSLSFDGFTTGNLNWNANGAQVDTALEALPTIGTGGVTVVGDYDVGYLVVFTGLNDGVNVANLIINSSSLTPATVPAMAVLKEGTPPRTFSVTGDWQTGYTVTFFDELAGIDHPTFTVTNATTPSAFVLPTAAESTKGGAELLTLSGSGINGTGALRAVAGHTTFNGTVALKTVPLATFPWDWINPDLPWSVLGSTWYTATRVQSVGADTDATLTLNGRITQTLVPSSLAKVGEGTLAVGGVTDNNTDYDAYLKDVAYEQYTFVNAGTVYLDKSGTANAALNSNWLIVGDNNGPRESDRLVYTPGGYTNQFGSSIANWRSGLIDFNGRGDDIGELRLYDSKVLLGNNASGGVTITNNNPLRLYGGTVNLQNTNLILGSTTGALSYEAGSKPALITATGIGMVDIGNRATTWNVYDGQGLYDLTVEAPITGTAGSQLIKAQAGVLALTGDNAFVGTNEVHTAVIPGSITSFAITYNGQTSPIVNVADVTAGAIQRAYESLPIIGQGNLRVTGGLDETQYFKFSAPPTGGNYKLSFNGFTTTAINYNYNAAQVEAALIALPSIAHTANVDVSGAYATGFLVLFRGALGGTDVPTMLEVDTSTLNPAGTITCTPIEQVKGGRLSAANEVQTLVFDAPPTAGSYKLTFRGATTGVLNYNFNAAQVASALTGLSTVGASNVVVAGSHTRGFTFTFQNALSGSDVPTLELTDFGTLTPSNTAQPREIEKGGSNANSNEVVNLMFAPTVPTSGNYNLTFRGQTTTVSHNFNAAQIQTALQNLSTIGSGNVTVSTQATYSTGGFAITFQGVLGLQDIETDALTVDVTGLAPAGQVSAVLTTTTEGGESGGYNEVQAINLGAPTAGTYSLTFSSARNAGANVTTASINYNANAAQVQTALESLASISAGDIRVIGDRASGFLVVFDTGGLRNVNQASFTLNVGTLAGGTGTRAMATLRDGASALNTVTIAFVNGNAGADVSNEAFLTLGGDGFVNRMTTTEGVFSTVVNAGVLALGHDNAAGLGSMSFGGAGTLWGIGGTRRMKRLVTLSNAATTLGARREWGGTDGIWLSNAQLAGTTGGTTIAVDDPQVDAKIGFVNEVQSVTLLTGSATGSWTLSFNGETTIPLPYNATARMVELALDSLSTIKDYGGAPGSNGGSVSVLSVALTGTTMYYVMFQGTLGAQDIDSLLVAESTTATGQKPMVAESTKGSPIGGGIAELSAGRTLTKVGPGTLTLATNSSYTGATYVGTSYYNATAYTAWTGGVLRLQNANSLGRTAGSVVDVQGNAAVEIDGTYAPVVVSNLNLVLRTSPERGFADGYLHDYRGALRNVAGNSNVWSGEVDLRSQDTADRWVFIGSEAGNLTLAGEVTGSDNTGAYRGTMGLVKTGAATVTTTSWGANTLTGSVLLADGTLSLKSQAISLLGTAVLYVGDPSIGTGRDVLEIGGTEQVADTKPITMTKTGKIVTLPEMTQQVSREVARVDFSGTPTGGVWYLTFDPDGPGPAPREITAALPWNASPAQVGAALTDLPSIGGTGAFIRALGCDVPGQGFDSYFIAFRGTMGGWDVPDGYLGAVSTGLLGTNPGVVVSEATKGGVTQTASNSEVQRWSGINNASPTISFRGATTATVSNTAQPAVIEAALNALPTIGGAGGYVRVNGAPGDYYVTFLGALSGAPIPNLVPSHGTITETSRGALGPVETLGAITATLGDTASSDIEIGLGTTLALNGTLTYRVAPGVVTGSAANISGQGELSLLSALATAVGTRVITVDDGPAEDDLIISAKIGEGLAGIQANLQKDGAGPSRMVLNPVSGANSYTGITTVNSGYLQVRAGDALGPYGTNEVQTIQMSTVATAGTWTITYGGETTAELPYDATPGEVAAALNALTAVQSTGGSVRVATSAARTFLVSFMGGTLGNTNLPNDILSATSYLTPSITFTVNTSVEGGQRLGTVVNASRTLELQGGVMVTDEPLSVTGQGINSPAPTFYVQTVNGQGALRAVGGEATWLGTTPTTGVITAAGDTAYGADAGSRLVLSTSIAHGTRVMYKVGPGELEITSSSGVLATYTGTSNTFINEGTVVLNRPTASGNEAQTLAPLGLTDEQQRIAFSVTNPATGNFTLSFQGQVTSALSNAATAAQVQAALEALPSVGTGNVSVVGSMTAGFTVMFINARGDVSYDNLVAANTFSPTTTIYVTEEVDGGQDPAGGTYTLSFNNYTTWPLDWNASVSEIQAALEAVPTVGAGNVVVSRNGGGETVFSFQGFLANVDAPAVIAQVYQIPVYMGGVAVPVTTAETQRGGGDELQTVSFNANATIGTFLLGFNGYYTTPMPYNVDAAAMQAALEAVPSIGVGNVEVMGNGVINQANPFVIHFRNSLGQTDVAALAVSAAVPGVTVAVGEMVKGGYGTAGISLSSGTIFIGDGRGVDAIRYGANASSNSIADGATLHLLASGVFDTRTVAGDKSERVTQVWLGQGTNSSAQINTGTGTLALNPTGDTGGFYTLVFPDTATGPNTWAPVTIDGNIDLASAQAPRTRRWFRVAASPATATTADLMDTTRAGVVVNANIAGAGGLEKSGQGKLILAGDNSYSGDTIVNEGVLQVQSNTALGSAAQGTTVEWGGALMIVGELDTAAEPLLLASGGTDGVPAFFYAPANDADPAQTLTYNGPLTINYPTPLTASRAIDSLNVTGAITLNAPLTVGANNDSVTLGGPITSGPLGWVPGLLEGRFIGTSSMITSIMDESFPNSGTGGVKLAPEAAETAAVPPWGDHMGYVYTGQFYDADGVFTFAENFDDMVVIKIDGVTRLRNATAAAPSTTGTTGYANDNPFGATWANTNYGMGPAGDGWHDIEIRVYNTTGGSGPYNNNFWNSTKGLGFDPNSINLNTVGNAYQVPTDPGNMTLFRTKVSADNMLTKVGSGTLTLGGDNSYTGPTNIDEGTLILAGSTGTGAVTIAGGVTVKGDGTVKGEFTLQDGAILDPGPSAGRITVAANTVFAAGSLYKVNLDGTTPATEHDQVVQNGTIDVTGAKLEVTLGYTPAELDRFVLVDNDGTEPIVGLFVDSVSGLPIANHSIVTISGQTFRIFYDGGTGNDVVLVRAAPLAVTGVLYDAGADTGLSGTQKSVVSRVVVTFNGLIDSYDAGPFAVARLNGGPLPVNSSYSTRLVGESTEVTIVFTGGDSLTYARTGEGGYSLNDGNYRLTVDKTAVHSNAGDMATSYQSQDEFFRFFGDTDGDRDTDGTDMFNMRRVLAGDPAYDEYRDALDYDGNGVVNSADYSEFRTRYGRRLLPPT